MDNISKLKLNTLISLLLRFTLIVSGLILPRLIIVNYGSEANGLVSSITQFLSVITFLDLGVGAVVQSTLYKPIALNDYNQISKILKSARNYFRKIAFIIIAYVLILIYIYPTIIQNDINVYSTAFLIIAMSINMFSRYYFGIVNELLLNADQLIYIQQGYEILTVILNLLLCALLINTGFTIQIVMLGSGLVFLIRPIFLKIYVDKNYNIDYNIKLKEEPIKQKWNGMAQHVAYTVQNSTDIVVLTIFSTLDNVSIYSIHNMIVISLQSIILSITSNFKPLMGNLLAKNEVKKLNNYFSMIEWSIHTLVVFLFGLTAVLINSFVELYTQGVDDIVYFAPLFSLLLVLAQAIYVVRQPYHMIVLAAGHYRETQSSSIIEAILNVLLSTLMVNRFGLVGVAIGTVIALGYRTLYLVKYLSINILKRSPRIFFKQILVDIFSISLVIYVGKLLLLSRQIENYLDWVFIAIVLALMSVIILFAINFLLYRNNIQNILGKLIQRIN